MNLPLEALVPWQRVIIRTQEGDFVALVQGRLRPESASGGVPPPSAAPHVSGAQLSLLAAEVCNQTTTQQRKLFELLYRGMDSNAPLKRYRFQEIVDCCYKHGLFSWMLNGDICITADRKIGRFKLTPQSCSQFGLFIEKEMCNREVILPDGRQAFFRREGKHRHRRFVIEIAV